MRTLNATFQIVTPMFLGDADQQPSSLRPPSIRGVLHFWWRAINWGRCLERENGRTVEALKRLHSEEAALFGIAADESTDCGQSKFLPIVSQQPIRQPTEDRWPVNNTGSGYLAFGLLETRQDKHRRGFLETVNESPNTFSIRVIFKRQTRDEEMEQFRQALHVWGLLGGLGSRARRGFGSVALTSVDYEAVSFADADSYCQRMTQLLNAGSGPISYPPYTALSRHTALKVLGIAKSARQALELAGIAYRNHRGQPSTLRGKVKVAFGLPLQGVDEENRRASALFFHVHPLANKEFVVIALYMPAQFHPQYRIANLDSFYAPVRSFVM